MNGDHPRQCLQIIEKLAKLVKLCSEVYLADILFRYDMAELMMRMGQYDKAEKAINVSVEHEAQNTDINSMVMLAKLYNLLAKVNKYDTIKKNNRCIIFHSC